MRVIYRKINIIILFLILPFLVGFTGQDQNNNFGDIVYKHKNGEYSKVTDDPKIMRALDTMVGTTGEFSRNAILGNNISGKPVRIEFKDLGQISPMYFSFDALGWKKSKHLYIYINIKHNNAPPEAIGSLLSHEALHQDDYNSKDEETYAWSMEADVWLQMKKRNPNLDKLDPNEYPLVTRENKLGEYFIEGHYTNKKIRRVVESNSAYKNLPQRSPGFEDDN